MDSSSNSIVIREIVRQEIRNKEYNDFIFNAIFRGSQPVTKSEVKNIFSAEFQKNLQLIRNNVEDQVVRSLESKSGISKVLDQHKTSIIADLEKNKHETSSMHQKLLIESKRCIDNAVDACVNDLVHTPNGNALLTKVESRVHANQTFMFKSSIAVSICVGAIAGAITTMLISSSRARL